MPIGVHDQVTTFIVDNFLFGDAERVPADGDSLLEAGIIDSTGVLELIEYLEAEFAIRVGDLEAVPENLGTIANICAFVERKQA